MMRDNVMTDNSGACISIIPRNPAGDNITDITIANNTGIINSTAGNFINITAGGAAGAITLANNLWIAPNVIPGENGAAAVSIDDTSAKVLKLSRGNVWQMPTVFNSYAAGGVMYIWPAWRPPRGYYTPAAWDALPFVVDDLFSATAVTSSGYVPDAGTVAATADQYFPGVLDDINGSPFPLSGPISAGAVQV
jgi:hypothetical protein